MKTILELIKNAKALPSVFYGMHMADGVAEYAEEGREPYRILINEMAIKNMDPTFAGKPVYVRHVEEVDLAKLQEEADGYVIESFYNKADGKHWAKFIVVSDKGHEAIRMGWKLSNAYIPKDFSGGGQWHGVEYAKEVTRGEYEHLAIVPNPRYEESIILTPDQFKEYNSAREHDLLRLANEKQGAKTMGLNFFKRKTEKIENGADLEATIVVLPKSKKEITISDLVKNADEAQMPEHMANGDHMVEVAGSKMKVNDLVAKHAEMCNELSELKKKHVDGEGGGEDEEAKKANAEAAEKEAAEKKANEDKASKEAAEKKANDDKAAEEKKANEKKNFDALKNAADSFQHEEVAVVNLSSDMVARGKELF